MSERQQSGKVGRPQPKRAPAGTRSTATPPGSHPLPMSRREMEHRGWEELDVLLVTGDAYVDHPSFGVALLARCLEARGYRVGVAAQPRWDRTDDIAAMGRPRLYAGVTAGAMDSMLAHYTAFRKLRSDDAYTPGGRAGARPNRASIVYSNLVRQAFPGLPVVLGGVEASMRRVTHYDFWTDKLRRSILLDSKADLLVYGMAERAVVEIARRLAETAHAGVRPPELLRGIPGTAFALSAHETETGWAGAPDAADVLRLASHEEIEQDPKQLMTATLALERQAHQGRRWAVQYCGGRPVLLAPPATPLSTAELDALYALPYTRRPHPAYTEPIPAAQMIQFSMTAHRGCAAGCTFCSITLHQGRQISSRSAESLEAEARTLTRHPDWTGSITDVGGPTANMWGAYCAGDHTRCNRADCLTPKVCPLFKTSEPELVDLLRRLRSLDGVKHLRVASGVRYDIAREDGTYLRALIREFVGGQLKIAPEHCRPHVLSLMRKPDFAVFERFLELFGRETGKANKEQYVIPYLISAFPGCTVEDMRALGRWLRERGWKPQQVQCFIPTPGTVATAMFHAGIDTKGNPIPVARTDRERLHQHAILVPSRAPGPRGQR